MILLVTIQLSRLYKIKEKVSDSYSKQGHLFIVHFDIIRIYQDIIKIKL